MSETAQEIITDALALLLIDAEEQSIQPSEMKLSIRFLNRMMGELDANGISLGYTIVTNPADVLTVPDGALSGITSNLATKLAAVFGAQVDQSLAISASDGYKALLKLGVTIEPSTLPCTLSKGSGNDDQGYDDKFYPCDADSVLTETNGNILLESGT